MFYYNLNDCGGRLRSAQRCRGRAWPKLRINYFDTVRRNTKFPIRIGSTELAVDFVRGVARDPAKLCSLSVRLRAV